jgi:hypothetical protein
MQSVTCDHCGCAFKFETSSIGRPVTITGVGDMVTVRCEGCDRILTVQLDLQIHPELRYLIGN